MLPAVNGIIMYNACPLLDVGGDDGLSWHEFKVFKQKFATLK